MRRALSILKTAVVAFGFFLGITLVIELVMRAPHNGGGFDAADGKGVLDLIAVPVAIVLAIRVRREQSPATQDPRAR